MKDKTATTFLPVDRMRVRVVFSFKLGAVAKNLIQKAQWDCCGWNGMDLTAAEKL